MDKKIIKNFAVNARRKLIEEVTTKARRLGINEFGIENVKQIDSNLQEIEKSEIRIQGKEITQRNKLIAELRQRASITSHSEAFQELIEEVAYTWFNRLIAIRFMEVNGYLPDMYRVLSSETVGKIEPDIITDIYDADIFEEMSSDEQQQVRIWKADNSAAAMDKLYQLVFVKICNQLNDYLPELFEPVEDYTELLFTASYIKKDGVIADLLCVPENDFNVQAGGQVEIIGWLYQYYNSEPHEQVVNIYKGTVKKKDIPAATQLFTTDWVVHYMVDNSLGKYWIDHYPDSDLRDKLEYLIPDKCNTDQITSTSKEIKPEELKVIDNAMGSGHILVYAFDVLMEIYLTLGYSERDAARAIVEHNLYGLEIDKRAYQLAYFAIMMKGRQYDRLFLKKNLKPHLKEFIDSPKISEEYQERITGLNNDKNGERWNEYKELIFDRFENGKELGSIIRLVDKNSQVITKQYLAEVRDYLSKFNRFTNMDILYGMKEIQEKYLYILEIAELLVERYTVVVTNPPYLNKMDKKLKKYVNDNYSDVKKDLFSVFIQLNSRMIKKNGYASFMTPFVWMFISSYEKLRSFLINERNISSLIQMEYSAFEEATVPICTFTIKNTTDQNGNYIKLSDFTGGMEVQRIKTLEAIINYEECDYFYHTSQDNFKKIPGMPIAYWLNNILVNNFTAPAVGEFLVTREGMATANNDLYIRVWHEVSYKRIGWGMSYYNDKKKWYPYNKGGKFKKWYGNNQLVVDWENDGEGIKNNRDEKTGRIRSHNYNGSYGFKEGITWSSLSSGSVSFRYSPRGSLFDSKGAMGFSSSENIKILLAFLNSSVAQKYLEVFSPTLDYKVGDIILIPYLLKDIPFDERTQLVDLTEKLISNSKNYYKIIENSYEFESILLSSTSKAIELDYFMRDYIFNINTLNRKLQYLIEKIITPYYGYQLKKDDIIFDKELTNLNFAKVLISFSIGIIFGRYSLDEEGLIFAGGAWDPSRYKKFKPDADNILLITDDEYFKDGQFDIVNRFIDFVEVTFGKETLEENLQFIADNLGGNGEPKEVIRRYFVKDFYKDHLKTYFNRPIYWQLDSGKQNGFKALMYLHRYTPDQLGNIRTEYLHELQKVYDNRIELRQQQIAASDNQKDINKMEKEITKIKKQLKEIRAYDEKLGHLALKRIDLDLDDGVIVNYDKLQRDPDTGEKFPILAKGVKEPKK